MAELAESLLQAPERLFARIGDTRRPGRVIAVCLALALGCHLAYGLIVGAFSGGVQLWAAPLKVALGAFAAAALCLPSLYIFGSLAGAAIGLGQAAAVLAAGLALTSILLVGFAPVAFVFTFSSETVAFMGFFHLLAWIVSVAFGLALILAGMHMLRARRMGLLAAWAIVLIATTLQMSTALRPIVGSADTLLPTERRFFVVHWWETALGSRVPADRARD